MNKNIATNDLVDFAEGKVNGPKRAEIIQYLLENHQMRKKVASLMMPVEPMEVPEELTQSVLQKITNTSMIDDVKVFLAETIRWISPGWKTNRVSYAFRGIKEKAGNPEQNKSSDLSISKCFGKFEVEISVTRVSLEMGRVDCKVRDMVNEKDPELRAGLFQNGRELASQTLKGGRASFRQVKPGCYRIKLWDRQKDHMDLRFSILSEAD